MLSVLVMVSPLKPKLECRQQPKKTNSWNSHIFFYHLSVIGSNFFKMKHEFSPDETIELSHIFWTTKMDGGKTPSGGSILFGIAGLFFSEAKDVRNRICVFAKEMVTRRLIFWGFLVPKSSKGTGRKFGYYLTTLLAAGFKYFLFSPRNPGEDSQFD